jgi:hypothetical protein
MPPRRQLSFLVAAASALLAGCEHVNTRTLPSADISNYHHIFVESRRADSYGIADEIARQLRLMGYDATSGAPTMMTPGQDLIVSYDDMWMGDFKTYMVEFDVQVRAARGDKILAMGHCYKPSMMFGHPPADMIHELLAKLFKHA